MSLSVRCFAHAQISFLVANTTKKNYKANCAEIAKLVDMYGPEAGKHLFRCLLSSVDLMSDGRSYGKDGQQLQMLCQEANALVSKPNFVSILCYGFEKQENKSLQPSSQLLTQVAKVLKLGNVQEVVFALGLTASTDSSLSFHAAQHLKLKLPELVRSYSDMSSSLEGGLGDVAIEVLHRLLSHLLLSPEDEVGVAKDSVDAFVQTLRRDFPRERVPVVLSPLIYREQQDITEDRLVPVSVALPQSVFSIELAEIIKDVGYAATATKQDMVEILKDYGKQNITIKSVARVLGMMATTLTGLPDSAPFMGVTGEASHASIKGPGTWDVKNFVSAVQSLVPNMPWRELILHLDYQGFYLPSPEALSLIMTAYNMACREPFPLECVHLTWANPRGQLSWYQQALAGCPEFSVSQYMGESVDLEPFKISLSSEETKPCQRVCYKTTVDRCESGYRVYLNQRNAMSLEALCPGESDDLITTPSNARIFSPRYNCPNRRNNRPLSYRKSEFCLYNVSFPDCGSGVIVIQASTGTQVLQERDNRSSQSDGVCRDYVQFTYGRHSSKRYCGSELVGFELSVPSRQFLAVFWTDTARNAPGFQLTARCLDLH